MPYHASRSMRLCAGVLTILAGAAAAQDRPPPPKDPQGPADTYQPARDARPVVLVPVRSLIGTSVRGSGDEKIGEVNELVLSRERGRIAFALVGHGGVMKISEKVTAVPDRKSVV